jgi:hypothetical protein
VVITTKASNRARAPNVIPAITIVGGANFGRVFSMCALNRAYAAALQSQERYLGLFSVSPPMTAHMGGSSGKARPPILPVIRYLSSMSRHRIGIRTRTLTTAHDSGRSGDFVIFGFTAVYGCGDDKNLCVFHYVLLLLYSCRAGTVIEVIN